MALARFVLTADVTLPADALTPGSDGRGDATGTDAAGHWGITGAAFRRGQVIFADSSAGSAGPQLLYQAIGSASLRAYADTDAVGRSGVSN